MPVYQLTFRIPPVAWDEKFTGMSPHVLNQRVKGRQFWVQKRA